MTYVEVVVPAPTYVDVTAQTGAPGPPGPSQGQNVRDHGATGDGITDDTAAINSAITAAAGGEVFVPNGTYLTTGLTLVAGTTLRGEGWGSVITIAVNGPVIALDGVDDVRVRSLRITGSADPAKNLQRGVQASAGSGNLLVEDVWVDGCFRGLCLAGDAPDARFIKCLVTNDQSDLGAIDISGSVLRALVQGCTVRDAVTHGIDVRQSEPQHIRVVGNHVTDPGDTCIVVSGGGVPGETIRRVIVGHNTTEGGMFGLVVENGAHHVIVSNNSISAPSMHGILIGVGTGEPAAYVSLTDNMIDAPGQRGIFFNAPIDSAASGNTITGYGSDGIRIAGGTGIQSLVGNRISGGTAPGGFGIRVDAGGRAAITGGFIRNVAGSGISIEAPNCTVIGVQVEDCDNTSVLSTAGIFLTPLAGRTIVSGCISRRSGAAMQDYGIILDAGCLNAIVTGNVAFPNATPILNLGTGTVLANNVTT